MIPSKSAVVSLLLFGGVGLLSSLGYFASMSICIEVLRFSVFGAAFVAFCIGTLISYLGNTLLTFRGSLNSATLARFLVVVMTGMVVNQVIAFGLNAIGAHYVFIALTVFAVVPIFNFIGHSLFTYRERGHEGS
ncbi:GtrA family protein [Microvirga arabica]|uniref:GtrA family protein n=1 Tax=Microvirga arabica TaxID=1128671 RepID=A0ABV6YB09_9HYPH